MDERFMEIASEIEQTQRDLAAKRVADQNKPQTHPDFDGANCVRCEEPIPTARLAMGRVRCTACQTLVDRHGSRA